ncbi:MAG: glutamyl-tRNA reductase, partial [Candidatus Eremiobacteraeota bacterium]|nr:glutamyl-tRNA reductase [Candidatus Eremiobacteraeota bacterium]
CLGLSHNTAPVEVRERHAFPPHRMGEALIALRDYEAIREALMLQTCGRLEIYAELEDYEVGVGQLKTFLGNFRHGDVSDMDSYMYTLLGTQAIDHLIRVSTGLDSMLIGEAEILGQVKDAYVQAQRARSLGKTLHTLFREALEAGKEARTHTAISGDSTSIATAAVACAKEHVGDLGGKRVLVIGAGKMGAIAARRLKAEGAGEIIVLNRTHKRAQAVVDELGSIGRTAEMPGLVESLKTADVVVTSTGASHFVLTPGNVAEAMLARPDRPLFIVDIAVPRDVDPEVTRIPGIGLVDIDGLKDVVDVTLEKRRAAIPLVEEIIAEHVERFQQWYQSRVAVPVIASLTQKAAAIRESELERLFARLPDLTERERLLITGMSMTIVSKLLHSAIVRIRDKAAENRAEALTHAKILDELFELQALDEDGTFRPPPPLEEFTE